MTKPPSSLAKAVLDANVLAPAVKSTALRQLAEDGLYIPVLSQAIWQEAEYSITRLGEDKTEWAARTLSRWQQVPSILWAEAEEPPAKLPDAGDSHVLGTALAAGADIIVTENIRDFPKKVLGPLGLTAMGTDKFVLELMEAQPTAAHASLLTLPHHANLPFLGEENLLTVLRRAGFRRVVKRLQSDG